MAAGGLALLALALLCFALPRRVRVNPPGAGAEIVQTACSACHSLNNLREGHTHEDWTTTLAMMRNVGAQVSAARRCQVGLDYLGQQLSRPPVAENAAVILLATETVSFQEWTVPTPGSRPHDRSPSPTASIWFTGHMGGLCSVIQNLREQRLSHPPAYGCRTARPDLR